MSDQNQPVHRRASSKPGSTFIQQAYEKRHPEIDPVLPQYDNVYQRIDDLEQMVIDLADLVRSLINLKQNEAHGMPLSDWGHLRPLATRLLVWGKAVRDLRTPRL